MLRRYYVLFIIELALQLGIDSSTVAAAVARAGHHPRSLTEARALFFSRGGHVANRRTDLDQNAIIRRFKSGEAVKRIAADLGVSGRLLDTRRVELAGITLGRG